jgi:uncharacterized membrane protein (DUF485 family)
MARLPDSAELTKSSWDRLARSPRFRQLIREKRRFLVPASLFFMVYYFALPILVGYWPEMMKQRVLGPVNIAYLFALSQFVMAWVVAWIYVSVAARFDKLAQEVIGGEQQDK